MNDLRIFCDQDGVIADWCQAFRKISGHPDLTIREYERLFGQEARDFIIESHGEQFWADLPWTSNGKELWNFIISEFPYNSYILSAPIKPKTIEGKSIWIRRELQIHDKPAVGYEAWDGISRIIFEKKKFLICQGINDILIDDSPRKLEDWVKAGGTGILHSNDNFSETIKVLQGIKYG